MNSSLPFQIERNKKKNKMREEMKPAKKRNEILITRM